MKKRTLSGLLLSSVLALSIANPASADEKDLKVEIEPSDKQITLDWNDTGATYKIFDNKKLIWEGVKSEAVISNLKSKHLYSFNLVSFDENNKENYATKINTQTAAAENKSINFLTANNTPSIDEGFIDAVVNSDNIFLKLRNSIIDEHDGKVEIYKNNKLVSTTTEKNYTDTDVLEGKTYNYRFVLRKKLSNVEIEKAKQYLNENNIEITPEIKEEVFYEPYEYTKVVTVPEDSQITTFWSPPADPAANQIGFMYRTFIPNKFVPARSLVDGWTSGYQFGGDNRGFSFNGGTARTTAEAVVTFTSSSSKLNTRKEIASSHLYNSSGRLLESSPGKGSITFDRGLTNKDQLFFRIDHSAAVGFSDAPQWITPDIDYTVGINAYRDGSISASGTRDQAPNHEFYIYSPYSSFIVPLFQATNKGFSYLAPIFPNASINISRQ
ncbi:DUF3238 domain-containing protein [Bacillus seohaeanensis]|uniref:DUF3238 domain-containing protein n=1 Tax=Bacillus seohaeanensis TaxID=284580 RepID=A0ABW5RY43_9BACI